MSIYSRLTEVHQQARQRPIPFDDSSKLILFSDCHRGDNSWADEFARNQTLYFFALEYYYDRGFTYIELGDGDELYKNRDFSEIRYAHSHVFWLLKQFYDSQPRRFYLIHGNHDMERADPQTVVRTLYHYNDERTGKILPLFEGLQVHEGLVLSHTPTGGEIFLVHGHQGDPLNDRFWKVGRFLSGTLWRPLQLFGITEPTSPARNFKKRDVVEAQIQDWIQGTCRPLIFGHTHKPSFAKKGEPPYFNTGSCVHPRCITGIEIEQGGIALVKWWLAPDDGGRLCVTREVLEGPREIASLFGSRPQPDRSPSPSG
jgi:UDP-2,3-diacylglucosamine pyrophosphatase LpxH